MTKAATTRLSMLQKAFELIYKNGYQATSVDYIIATMHVTKGAFFYHFKNKEEMDLAMINEVMYPGMHEVLIKPLKAVKNPLDEIYTMMKNVLLQAPFFEVKYGCPAVNLIEEMASLNESFHKALSTLIIEWQKAIQASISQGIADGKIRKDVNPQQVAYFIIAGYSGIRNMGKLLGTACYAVHLKELKKYLATLA